MKKISKNEFYDYNETVNWLMDKDQESKQKIIDKWLTIQPLYIFQNFLH
jgi:hypothetical protein